MWNEIRSEQDIRDFMDKVYALHDSCIKEMHYVSGASVDADLRMYPLNDECNYSAPIRRCFDDRDGICRTEISEFISCG